MNCEDFKKHTGEFLKGTLDNRTMQAMRAHRATCPVCSRLLQLQRMVGDILDETESVRAPGKLVDSILAAVEAEEKKHSIEEVVIPSPETVSFPPVDCGEFERSAAAFVEGRLDLEMMTALNGHLESCAACARLTGAHRLVYASLDSAEPIMAPEGLAERILGTVRAEADFAGRVRERYAFWRLAGTRAIGVAAYVSFIAAFSLVAWIISSYFREEIADTGGSESLWMGFLGVIDNLRGLISSEIAAYAGDYYLIRISAMIQELVARLSSSVFVPYTTYSLPLLHVIGLAITVLVLWWYLNPRRSYTTAVPVRYEGRHG